MNRNNLKSLMEYFIEDNDVKTYPARFEEFESDYKNPIYYYGFTYSLFAEEDEDNEPELIIDYTDRDIRFEETGGFAYGQSHDFYSEKTSPIATDCDEPKLTYRIYDKEVNEQEFIISFIEAAKDSEYKFNFTEDDVKNLIKSAVEDCKHKFLETVNDNVWDYLDD